MNSHCVLQKCGVWFNFPTVFTKCGVCINSPLCFYKMCSLLDISTLFLKNAEFTRTLPQQNPPELPLCVVCLTSDSVHKKCRVQMNSSLCSPKMRSLIQLLTCFYKMQSSHQLPTLHLKNAQSAWPLHFVFEKCGVLMNSASVESA